MQRWLAAILLGFALGGAAAAGPLVNVTGVADNDSLNLRAEPDPNSARVGTIDAHDTGIEVIAVDTRGVDWVKIRKGQTTGWVNAKFLAYQAGLPVKLKCVGTEPFWGIALGYQFAAVDFTGLAAGKRRISLAEPVTAASRPYPWLVMAGDKGASFLVIDQRVCSDGMSDTSYPYAVTASVAGHFLEGCCK